MGTELERSSAGQSCREAIEAWKRAEESARFAESALSLARANLSAARCRASERRRRAQEALGARQEAFAQHLLDAADAHDANARRAEQTIADLETRHRELRRIASARHASLLRILQEFEPPARLVRCTACRWREVA